MMNMAIGEGFPLRQGAIMSLDWLSVATEASAGGTPDLLCSLMVLGYMDLYRRKKSVGGAPRGRRGWRARPLPRGLLEASLTSAPRLLDHVRSKNHAPKIMLPKVSFRLGSI